MRVGIVGSRRRHTLKDRQFVYDLVKRLYDGHRGSLSLVSGGCPVGADSFAEEAARVYEISMTIHYPEVGPVKNRWNFTKAAFARNKKIAEDSDVIYAFVAADRKGGTENTISHAHEFRKTVYVVDDSGASYLEHGPEADKTRTP